jgi:hypothetical protein
VSTPRVRSRGGELGQQARLAHAGLAADQQGRVSVLAGVGERFGQHGQLLGSPDQDRA